MDNMKGTTAFPLQWPAGQPRTASRGHSKFGERTMAVVFRLLKEELSRLGARYVVVSTNVPLKADGDPYSNPGRMPDPGCAVYCQLKGKPYCFPCDRWNSVEDNLYAVTKHIEAMRGMERWGVGSAEQNFAGFKHLAADNGGESWWAALDVAPDASITQIETAYRVKARLAHPDAPGGSHDAMSRLNLLRDQALSAAKGAAK